VRARGAWTQALARLKLAQEADATLQADYAGAHRLQQVAAHRLALQRARRMAGSSDATVPGYAVLAPAGRMAA
jgi:hypothetical protein